jgi:hypothetical protein
MKNAVCREENGARSKQPAENPRFRNGAVILGEQDELNLLFRSQAPLKLPDQQRVRADTFVEHHA